MKELIQTHISEIVSEDYRAASVFKKHHIDYCCNGHRTLEAACESENVDPDMLIRELEAVQADGSGNSTAFNTWPIGLLAEYIERKHHVYVEERIPEIQQNLGKLCRVHGEQHPELFKIKDIFSKAAGELSMHMKKEELMLFPFIKKMEKAQKQGTELRKPLFGSVENPVEAMMHEHNDEGEYFRKISQLSNNYTPPQDACATYQVGYKMLEEFEEDLHLHIHLENNILFPQALALEKELSKQE